MKSSNRGVGNRKHRQAFGNTHDGPRMRLHKKMEAEKTVRRRKVSRMFSSVKEALKEV